MFATINSVQLYYSEYGNSDRLPIIFIHGFPFCSEMWKPQVNAMSSFYYCITYDVRGLGKSDVGDGQYTIDFFVDDLFALMDYLKIQKAILCGLSMGGYIAQRAIQRNPERVTGLILCNTKSEADTNQAKINRSNAIKLIKTEGIPAFAENFLKQIFSDFTYAHNPQAVELIRQIIYNTSPLGMCGVQLALACRIDTSDLLSTLQIPVLLIAGQYDSFAPPVVMEEMSKKISNSEYHILPHSAHMSNLEDTELFNKILLDFLGKHWKQ